MKVQNYGLHTDEHNITWVVQQESSDNIVGFPSSLCPFKIDTNLSCPHKFNLLNRECHKKELREFREVFSKFQIIKAFTPGVTNKNVLYIESTDFSDVETLARLQELHSPAVLSVTQFENTKDKVLRKLKSSNLGTHIIYGVKLSQWSSVTKLVWLASQLEMKLIIIGERIPICSDSLQFVSIPDELKEYSLVGKDTLRRLGNHALYEYLKSKYEETT